MKSFYNLKKFISLVLFLCPCASYSQVPTNDTLYARVTLMHYNDNASENIYCTIYNKTFNAYVTTGDFYFHLVPIKKIYVHPMSFLYSPNLLILRENDSTGLEGDGNYPINYCNFPDLFLIPAMSQRIIKINISKVKNYINKNWNYRAFVGLASKEDLDITVKTYYDNRLTEYENSFYDADTISANVFMTNSFNTNDCDSNSIDNINKIQNVFKIKMY